MSLILGFDFTSAPSRRKPIAQVIAALVDTELTIQEMRRLTSFAEFESALAQPGPWIAGFDFPFSLPRTFIEDVGWPTEWPTLVQHAADLGRAAFEQTIGFFRERKPAGQKHPLRAADVAAKSLSPLMLYGVPLAKMFFEGAPRIAAAGLSIVPCAVTRSDRVALEAYPALIARRSGASGYKDDKGGEGQFERQRQREKALRWLTCPSFADRYGFKVTIPEKFWDDCILDDGGDLLDAISCCVQAGWASLHRAERFGVPASADRLEGWIVDPETRDAPTSDQSAVGKISTDLEHTLDGIGAGLKVKHIETKPIATCAWDSEISTTLGDSSLAGFDNIPVVRAGRVVGVLERLKLSGNGAVSSCMRPLDDSILISSEESILRVLPALKASAYRLVLAGAAIEGIVTRSDIQKLPVRVLVFALVAELEKAIADALLHRAGEPEWTHYLDQESEKNLLGRAKSRKRKNVHLSLVELAYFSDKRQALCKLFALSEQQCTELQRIEILRNSVAHGTNYAESEESLLRFIDDVQGIETWIRRVDYLAST